MKASNKDILNFYFSPPDIHGVRKLSPTKKDEVEDLFTAKSFFRPMEGLERGWVYGYFNAGDLSGFISLGSDANESRIFHELRLGGKTYVIGERMCNVVSDGKMTARESGVALEWGGQPPEYTVKLSVESGSAKAKFTYSFTKLSEAVGPYRCVADLFGNQLSYFYLCPCKATLKTEIEGDYEKLGIGKELYDRVNGKEISSQFAYNESVRANAPMISEGWYWHLLSCYEDNPSKPVKAVGFMDLYYEDERPVRGVRRLDLNVQFYIVDLETGALELFSDAEGKLTSRDNKPFFAVTASDDDFSAEIAAQGEPVVRKIQGKKDYFGIHLKNIEYSAFPTTAVVKFHDKTYNAVGTSEIAGGKGQRWI
jgi:hypothetical protein